MVSDEIPRVFDDKLSTREDIQDTVSHRPKFSLLSLTLDLEQSKL